MSLWGEHGDEDVSDVTDKLGVLLYEIGELEDQYVDRYDQYRVTMKSIRNIEASVQPSRDSMFRQAHPCTSARKLTYLAYREAEDHGPDRAPEVQRAIVAQDCRP